MNTATETEAETEQQNSIEAHVPGIEHIIRGITDSPESFAGIVRRMKKESLKSLSEAGKRRLSPQELERIAFSIYISTFSRAVNLEYNDSDGMGSRGCANPCEQLEAEVGSYGIASVGFSAERLARPAFWFCAQRAFTDTYPREHCVDENGRSLHSGVTPSGIFMWRKTEQKEGFPALVSGYLKEFCGRDYREYMVSNLLISLKK